jgi:hypothetical protein
MSTESKNELLPDSLITAIGRVVISSVRLETALRYVVGKLSGDHDAGWIIFEGQSADWLILNGNAVLNEYIEVHGEDGRVLGSSGKHLRSLFKEAEILKNDRNIVIHGEWLKKCFFASVHEPQNCRPHSSNSLGSGELYHVLRSRYRRGFVEEAWNITDIETLASKMDALTQELNKSTKT